MFMVLKGKRHIVFIFIYLYSLFYFFFIFIIEKGSQNMNIVKSLQKQAKNHEHFMWQNMNISKTYSIKGNQSASNL